MSFAIAVQDPDPPEIRLAGDAAGRVGPQCGGRRQR